jgi:hypothetical protein
MRITRRLAWCIAGMLFLLMLLPLPAWAVTYWVQAGASTSTACSSIDGTSDPGVYRGTIGSGIACLATGDTLMIKDGTYTENFQFTRSGGGSEGTRTTYRAQNSGGVLVHNTSGIEITADWITIDGIRFDFLGQQDLSLNASFGHGTHVRISNGEIFNTATNCINGGSGWDHYLELINMHVHHCGNALLCDTTRCICGDPGCNDPNCFSGECHGLYMGSWNNLIDGCHFHNCSLYGGQCLHLYAGGSPAGGKGWSDSIIRNNIIHDTQSNGIGSYYGNTNQFYNNVIYNVGGTCIAGHQANSKIFNNTCYNSGTGFINDGSGNEIRNNISFDNDQNMDIRQGGTFSNNLCNSIGNGCTHQGDPGFVNTAGGNFRIILAGSPAVNAGINLSTFFTTDADGLTRPPSANWTIGAYEFAGGVPIGPLGLVQWLKLNNNTLDSSPNGFNGTATGGLTYGLPIVEGNSGLFNGVDAAIIGPNNPAFRPPQFGMAVWINTTALPPSGVCRMMSIGTTAVLGLNDQSLPFCYVNNGPTITGTSSILTGLNEVFGCSYDGTNLRLWRGASGSSQPLNVGQALSYSGSEVLAVGGVAPDKYCPVRADNVRFFDQPFDTASWQNIVNEVVPSSGMFTSHMRYYADAAEGVPLAAVDADLSVLPGVKLGIRFAIHNTGAQVNEYFPLWCSRNASAYVKVSKSFGSLGLRIADSTFVTMGQATTVPIPDPNGMPLDTFTPVPGQFVANIINPSSQKTIGPNQHREDEYRVETGSPATGGDFFDCVPRRESDVVFNAYNKINRLTLQSIAAPSSVRLGGVTAGGVGQ